MVFLKTYHFVKEYCEGVDLMYRGQEVNGSIAPVFHTDDFILKVTASKVTENEGKLTENGEKLIEYKIAIMKFIAEKPFYMYHSTILFSWVLNNIFLGTLDYFLGTILSTLSIYRVNRCNLKKNSSYLCCT